MSEPVRKQIRVRCTTERAFDVFTRCIDQWWPREHRRSASSELRLEPRVGGRIFELADDGAEAPLGEVRRWQPPQRLVYTWLPGAIDRPTEVDVRFTPDGDHTLVEVTHAEADSGLGPAWPARAERFIRAWGQVLPAFESFVSQLSTPEA